MAERVRRLIALPVAAIALAVLSGAIDVDFASSEPPRGVRATVTLAAPLGTGPEVPSGYFGLSTEYWTLPLYRSQLAVVERVFSLLHVPGSPLVLRIGGDSADHSFWSPTERRLPRWAFGVTPGWTGLVSQLVRTLKLRLIIDLNLISGSPRTAARWAAAAMRRLPPNSVVGFEIGNEPDLYSRQIWSTMTHGRMVGTARLPRELTPDGYVAAFGAYARLLSGVAPGVPLLAPALANPRSHERWLSALVAAHSPSLGEVTVHRYPFSACAHKPRLAAFPTVYRLLSRQASQGVAASLTPALTAASRAGLPLRLTELNSVSCGGRRGVSNTFATALWAPDALFALLERGVAGVNLHLRAETINAPFAVGPGGLTARPLLYGLLTFARVLGPQARIVRLHLSTARPLSLAVWGVQWGGRLHVLVIDKSRLAARVRLRGLGAGAGVLERLLAPSTRASSRVTLDGQHLNRDGLWVGRAMLQAVRPSALGYVLRVPGYSAALLSVPLGAAEASAPRATFRRQ